MKITILWADDEIDLLKPHIIFLEGKDYQVLTATNGEDAIDLLHENQIDIVFLDENMPGLTGLETLTRMKASHPSIPIIMITKSEEEEIMEDAIGSKISDYLIKPVNPKQILLSIKKNLDTKRLVSEKTTSNYQQEFRNIGMRLMDRLDASEWTDIYKQMVYWEMELDSSQDSGMQEILQMQKTEANQQFSKFIADNYTDWLDGDEDAPLLSHQVIEDSVLPKLKETDKPMFLVVIDNLRWDQWIALRPILSNYFRVDQEETFYSILPTATHYARNALFAGMMPLDIQRMFPNQWKGEDEKGKNAYEGEFLESLLKRKEINKRMNYNKVTNLRFGQKLVSNFGNFMNYDLNVIVYNFVDMLSHARTEMEVIRELASDESAYRSLTVSWFEHSPLIELFKLISEKGCEVVVTTDHGTVRVNHPSKIVGDKNTNTNLRYKLGKNLDFNQKEVYYSRRPEELGLPKSNVSSSWVFATEDRFFAYPNNYNHYVKYYKDTFQHGGISLEEMIVPLVRLSAK
jgi:CheY-like chemotaxis protein